VDRALLDLITPVSFDEAAGEIRPRGDLDAGAVANITSLAQGRADDSTVEAVAEQAVGTL
jgi:hypothetical protein